MSMPAERLIRTITLTDLLQGFADAPALPISGIASDSRQLQRGFLFLACQGVRSHGADYLDQAIEAGVAAIAYDATTTELPMGNVGVPMIAIDDLGRHLGTIANRFFESPSEAMQVIGVTGTNGKTTVAWLIAQCKRRLGETCGYVGTLGGGIGEMDINECMTTPATIELHRQLAEFREAGAVSAAVEVSSHALVQNRVDGIAFDSVLFTNLSRDHLDYHGDMQNYGDAKARLFVEYGAKQCIINLDSEFGLQLAERCGQDVIAVSTKFDRVANGRPYVFVRSVVANESGSQIRVNSSWGDAEFALPLPGEFNVANGVIVLALLLSRGVPIEKACAVLGDIEAPPGRMQRVPPVAGRATVYIDYAHTPDALEVALRALKAHCRGKLWCVFGCGGDRDAGKRPQMGRIAERHADHIVITSDNPRNEAPDAIIAAISVDLRHPDKAKILEDRATAIAWAINEARANDVVLIAGKGHETYQIVGDKRRDFSDFAVALDSLAEIAGAQ